MNRLLEQDGAILEDGAPIFEHFKVILEQLHDILENRGFIRTNQILLEEKIFY